ncbi:hypothetical protein [Frankia sp. Cas3]|uniref:hypothetical protein n=1 Tax=Frankia sp. Cas3 TaxID=3073926 RepID=UPI002AD4D5CA|nr:hypothetical protein [Frankia sp. Cas3]
MPHRTEREQESSGSPVRWKRRFVWALRGLSIAVSFARLVFGDEHRVTLITQWVMRVIADLTPGAEEQSHGANQ